MAEYIEREALIDALYDNEFQTFFPLDEISTVIDNIPAADVVEVRHGEWIYHECVSSYDGAKSGFACSVCSSFVEEEIFDMDEFNKNYCGACGAKMDGKGEGDA